MPGANSPLRTRTCSSARSVTTMSMEAVHPSRSSQRMNLGYGRRTGAHTFAGTAKRYLRDIP